MQPVRPNVSKLIGVGCLLAFGIVWTLFATVFLAVTAWSGAPWFFVLFPALFVVVGLALTGAGIWGLVIRPRLVGRHFSPPLASVEPAVATVGSTIRVRYEQAIRRDVEVRGFTMQLILRESATYRRGTNSYTVVHNGVVDSYEVPTRRLYAGDTIAEARTFRIPRDGMHSFNAPRNKLAWLVRIAIDTPNAPDVDEEVAFVVAPTVAAEADSAEADSAGADSAGADSAEADDTGAWS